MNIISFNFFIFLLLITIVYYVLPGRLQWIWLLITSIAFYFSTSRNYLSFLFFVVIIVVNWLLSQYMREGYKNRRVIYICALVVNLAFLSLFKYSRFFYNIYLAFGSLFHLDLSSDTLSFIVNSLEEYAPSHISYFALIIIGYITDVYWGKHEPLRNLGKFALFTGFFPQMTSGPIVTFDNMGDQFWGEKHHFSYEKFIFAVERILWGLFKKIVVAERCGVIVNTVYGFYETYSGIYIFIAAAMFALQLYCDFSGLMDFVIGIGECFQINLPENFNTPFYSLSLSEFWRRWHITLGAFLRDYVLYPIQRSKAFKNLRKSCKNRFGKGYEKKFNLPLYLSLLISWFLIGLWHGGGWNYIFGVGLYMWAVIVLGDILSPLFRWIVSTLKINTECASYRLFLRIRTSILFFFGLSFFRAESLKAGFEMWKYAFSVFNPWILFDESLFNMGLDRREWGILIFGVILIFVVSYISQKKDIRKYIREQNYIFRLILFSILFVMVIVWGYYGLEFNASEFIYGRF